MKQILKSINLLFFSFLSFVSLSLISFGIQEYHQSINLNTSQISKSDDKNINQNFPINLNEKSQNQSNKEITTNNPQKNERFDNFNQDSLLNHNSNQQFYSNSQPQNINNQDTLENQEQQNPSPLPIIEKQAIVEIKNIGTFSIKLKDDDTAFSILIKAGQKNNFLVDYQIYQGLGAFIRCISGICNGSNKYWMFYYNGKLSNVGASNQSINDGNITIWNFESR